ncbi:MAG: DUF624 domain-containing protein [Lachnospiraceae bacterium]|nr:DUF624 domain-containing protein [Lachnospiraceae bacterium]
MNKLFHPENPVMIFLSHIWDLIVLNFFFLLTSLPLFTLGASLTALSRVALNMAEGDFDGIPREYFSSFRKNFKQATPIWLLLLFISLFLGFDLYVVFFRIDEAYRILQYPVWLLLFADVSVMLYAFPLLARYEQDTVSVLKNSILLSLGNIPTTIFMLVVLFVIADLSLHNGSLLVLFFSLSLFNGCALLSRIFMIFLNRIFHKVSDPG